MKSGRDHRHPYLDLQTEISLGRGMNARDFLLLLLVCIIWAAHHVLGKVVVSGLEIPPLFYAAMRFWLVALVVSPWLFPIPEKPWRVAIAAFLISGASFGLLFVGLQTTTPSASVIVQQLGVPMMILLSMTMLGERISLRRGFGIALTIAGGLIVIWDPAGFVFSEGLVLVAIGNDEGN
jgi:O-acetylserine/cysteine efflux transporter